MLGKMSHYFQLFSFSLFFLGIIVGANFSEHYDIPSEVNSLPILEREFNENMFSFHHIFLNNLKVVLLLSFGGVLTFGGLTFLNLILNGVSVGIMFHAYLSLGELKTFFLLIFPHGIFEIPGLIIAGSAGFKIPYELLKFALGKKKEMITEEDAKEFFKLVGVSIALILIAAIIESKITLKLAACIR